MLKFLKNILAFLVALLGSIIVGWWLSQRRRQQSEQAQPAPSPAAEPTPIVLPPEAFEDVIVEEQQPDDLTVIKGIGNKMSDALADIGIRRFVDLASADAHDIKTRLGNMPVSVNAIEAWIMAAGEHVTN